MDVLTEYSSTGALATAIEKAAEEAADDRYLVGMARRARAVQDELERGQTATAKALEELFEEIGLADRRGARPRIRELPAERLHVRKTVLGY